MMSQIRATNTALARASSGRERPKSAKTLPLLASTSCLGAPVFRFGLLVRDVPFLIMLLCSAQPLLDQIDFMLRSLSPLLRLLLEDMQGVDKARELHRIDSPVSAAMMIRDHFEDSGPSKALQRLRVQVLHSNLGLVESEADDLAYLRRAVLQVLPG